MARKPVVVMGMLGSTLDAGLGAARWERWRPTVSLCQHPDLLINRLELLYQPRDRSLAEGVAKDIHQVSPETEVKRVEMPLTDAWDFEEVYGALHDYARAAAFDPEREDYLVHITTGSHVVQICMFLLAESRHLPARLIQTSPSRRGEKDRAGGYTVVDLDLSRYDRLATRFQREQREGLSFLKSGIETLNPGFNRLIERVEQVAIGARDPILLTGPTGSGKSRLAQKIFELKKLRRQITGPLVAVNCATLRGDGAMSALFGHVKGAFTGAAQDRPGLLKKAHGGVLFLDEIGELGTDEQAMLLHALEAKTFYPVGADAESASDFQLVAGTNRDLRAQVAKGLFREDLLARIDLWTFALPGLADWPEDIRPNLAFELDETTRALGRRITFNREAEERFLAFACSGRYRWPGNFRDFAGAVRRMATLAKGGRIAVGDVEEEIVRLTRTSDGADAASEEGVTQALGAEAASLDPFDWVQLAEVLRVCRSSRSLSDAGRHLFAASRATKKSRNDADRLRKYLARFGLEWSSLPR